MGEIAIHRDQHRVPVIVRPADAVEVRAPNAELALAVDGEDPRVLCGEAVDRVTRSVRRVIVEEQDVELDWLLSDLPVEPLDVLPLIVCGDEDERILQLTRHACSSASIRRRTICSKSTVGRQPVSRTSLAGFPIRPGLFLRGMEGSSMTYRAQSSPTSSKAIRTKSRTVCLSPVATTKSSAVPCVRMRCMAST